jgi:hypothetical protein
LPVTFVRIVNPKVPGGTLVLAWQDFDPALHTLFVPTVTRTESVASVVGDTVQIDLMQQHSVGVDLAEPQAPPAPAKPSRVRKPKPVVTPEAA